MPLSKMPSQIPHTLEYQTALRTTNSLGVVNHRNMPSKISLHSKRQIALVAPIFPFISSLLSLDFNLFGLFWMYPANMYCESMGHDHRIMGHEELGWVMNGACLPQIQQGGEQREPVRSTLV